MADLAKMQLPPEVGSEVFKNGDIAALSDELGHPLAETGRQTGLVHLNARYRDALDCVPLIDVFVGAPVEFLARVSPAAKGYSEQRTEPEQGAGARHCRAQRTPMSRVY